MPRSPKPLPSPFSLSKGALSLRPPKTGHSPCPKAFRETPLKEDGANDVARQLKFPMTCTHYFDLPSAGEKQPWMVIENIRPAAGESLRDLESISFQELDRQLRNTSKLFKTEFRIEDQPYFDKVKRRAVILVSAMVEGPMIKGLSYIYLGNGSATQLNFYSEYSEFQTNKPGFDAIADSFQFRAGRGWTDPGLVSAQTLRDHPFLTASGLRWAGLCGVLLVGALWKKIR